MEQEAFAEFELLVADAIEEAERRLADEKVKAHRRAVQLSREQGYHRLAMAIDRPTRTNGRPALPGQLSFFPTSDPSLFDTDDDAG